ncbi:MAG: 5'/3'-nucleotidase SurE [Deinococcus sp.]|nr:5'/3'-nucleotidase SurE [Deinococcus sp.]
MAKTTLLLTNDDGIYALGLRALAQVLAQAYQVVVYAPDRERSGISHAISLDQAFRRSRVELGDYPAYVVNGTPADCVALGLGIEEEVTAVVSGINRGLNVGRDITYSGTVGGAMEAALYSFPALAVSTVWDNPNYQEVAEITSKVVAEMLKRGLPSQTFLNLNVPPLAKGIKLATMSTKATLGAVYTRNDPTGREYHWVQGKWMEVQIRAGGDPSDTDFSVLREGYAALTPMTLDMTDRELLKQWQGAF